MRHRIFATEEFGSVEGKPIEDRLFLSTGLAVKEHAIDLSRFEQQIEDTEESYYSFEAIETVLRNTSSPNGVHPNALKIASIFIDGTSKRYGINNSRYATESFGFADIGHFKSVLASGHKRLQEGRKVTLEGLNTNLKAMAKQLFGFGKRTQEKIEKSSSAEGISIKLHIGQHKDIASFVRGYKTLSKVWGDIFNKEIALLESTTELIGTRSDCQDGIKTFVEHLQSIEANAKESNGDFGMVKQKVRGVANTELVYAFQMPSESTFTLSGSKEVFTETIAKIETFIGEISQSLEDELSACDRAEVVSETVEKQLKGKNSIFDTVMPALGAHLVETQERFMGTTSFTLLVLSDIEQAINKALK